ncbi:MAG: hypothetical protein ABIG63_20050 [Chloroflexota bacterium]
MQSRVARGLLTEPDSDLAADMYELASDKLEQAGYIQYEISNWAMANSERRVASGEWRVANGEWRTADGEWRVGGGDTKLAIPNSPHLHLRRSAVQVQVSAIRNSPFACRHNLQYWRNLPYLGFGAGAHGFANGIRTANVLAPAEYIRRLALHHSPRSPEAQPTGSVTSHPPSAIRRSPSAIHFPRTPATITALPIDRETEMRETMMMGLRLTQEGVSGPAFNFRFERALEDVFGKEIGELVDWELLEWVGDTLRLTPKGRLLGNQVFMRFV